VVKHTPEEADATMLRLIALRAPQLIVVLFLVTVLSFVLVNLLPGDIVHVILGDSYSPAAAAQIRAELGLNQPLPVRYVTWVGAALRGDFGSSLISHQSVLQSIGRAAAPTVELVVGGQLIATVLAGIVAVASVASRRRWVDRLGTALALVSDSIPSFVLGLILLALFSVNLHLFPSIGWQDPAKAGWDTNLSAMVLPCLLLGLGSFPMHMRVFRAELFEQLDREEYVTLARMKGVSAFRTMTRHVVRNSAYGLVTVTAMSISFMVAGAVLIEQIFSIPGVGTLTLTAIENRDSPMVQGCIVLLAVVTVVMSLLADLTYAVLDPRLSEGAQS
jgi:peptide/nickel transport system permease protein